MPVTKKQVLKKATAPRKSARKIAAPQHIWVISRRSKLFSWDPIESGTDFEDMNTRRKFLEDDSIYGASGYKLTRTVNRDASAVIL